MDLKSLCYLCKVTKKTSEFISEHQSVCVDPLKFYFISDSLLFPGKKTSEVSLPFAHYSSSVSIFLISLHTRSLSSVCSHGLSPLLILRPRPPPSSPVSPPLCQGCSSCRPQSSTIKLKLPIGVDMIETLSLTLSSTVMAATVSHSCVGHAVVNDQLYSDPQLPSQRTDQPAPIQITSKIEVPGVLQQHSTQLQRTGSLL